VFNKIEFSDITPIDDDAKVAAADPGSRDWAPTFWESDPPAIASTETGHLGGQSSASGHAWPRSGPHLQSTTRSPTPPAVVQTIACAQWLLAQLSQSPLSASDRDRTSPLLHHCALIYALVIAFGLRARCWLVFAGYRAKADRNTVPAVDRHNRERQVEDLFFTEALPYFFIHFVRRMPLCDQCDSFRPRQSGTLTVGEERTASLAMRSACKGAARFRHWPEHLCCAYPGSSR
jgi:hypothetical protein